MRTTPNSVRWRAAAEPVKCSGVPERVPQAASIEAQSAGVARATTSICNEEWRCLGRTSGRGGAFGRLLAAGLLRRSQNRALMRGGRA